MSRLDKLIAQFCPDGVEYVELGDVGPVCKCRRIMKAETSPVGDVPFFKIGTSLRNTIIPILPFSEQKRIVSILLNIVYLLLKSCS